MKQLILGGARSGKSRHAETLAIATAKPRIYLATAQALDDEMQARIVHHQQSRSQAQWITHEEPIALASALHQLSTRDNIIVVDCLTLWLTNTLLAEDRVFRREMENLLAAVTTLPGDIIFVSNETGLGIVPADPLSRRFVDEAGRLHQAMAAMCDKVIFITAGLPLLMKG